MVRAQELVDKVWARLSSEEPARPASGRCSSIGGDHCGNGLEISYPRTAVRFGYMNFIGEFTHEPDTVFSCGGKVVVRSDRGIELGRQAGLTCAGCRNSVSREQIRRYVENSGPEFLLLNVGHILREATDNDLMENEHLINDAPERIATCERLAAKCGLDIKIVASEHLLGGERIIFYFMAEGRVDFRELVRQLAGEYHTRIEMRQVGARDEARLIADYETCGRQCCCKNFLKTLHPISMKMAKMQKATLDPSKVSGRCGRLKCCLRYEHETYEELERKLPRLNQYVRTAHGEGVVVDRQILTQLVQLRTRDERLVTVAVEDVHEALDAPPTSASVPGREPDAQETREVSTPEPHRRPADDGPGDSAPSTSVRPPEHAGTAEPPTAREQQEGTDNGSAKGGPQNGTEHRRRRRRGSRRRRGGPPTTPQ